jgi:hypothetical protein
MVPSFLATAVANSAIVGYVEDFPPERGTAGFFSGANLSNPGTGGVGGSGDGFLLISLASPGNFGAATDRMEFTGNLLADGVTGFSFFLNDVGTDEDFEIHVGIGTPATSFWLYTQGFRPPENTWQEFFVDVTQESLWTRIQGTGTFQSALQNSQRLLFRHDLPPLVGSPDPIAGDLGIDRITVLPEPTSAVPLLVAGLLLYARKRRLRKG